MIENDSSVHESHYIVINPFEHQVGGHKAVLQISRKFICKPREEPEVEFYSRLPDCLKDCVPQYRGSYTHTYITCEKNLMYICDNRI